MLLVLAFLLVILAIAVGVVVLVAVPQIRSGEPVFSNDGRQAAAGAGERQGLPGRPRSAPAVSGPIPELTDGPAVDHGQDHSHDRDLVIDLREPALHESQEAARPGRGGDPG